MAWPYLDPREKLILVSFVTTHCKRHCFSEEIACPYKSQHITYSFAVACELVCCGAVVGMLT